MRHRAEKNLNARPTERHSSFAGRAYETMGRAFDFKFGRVYTGRAMMRVASVLVVGLMALPSVVDAQQAGGDEPVRRGNNDRVASSPSEPEESTKKARSSVMATEILRRAPDATPSLTDLANAKQISTQDKQTNVEKMLSEMRAALRRVTELLAEARRNKDVVQMNCLNSKLLQVKGLLRIAEDAAVKMYDAVPANAQDVINHEYTIISVAHQKVRTLKTDAEGCVGELGVYSGDTEINVLVDANVSDRDPTEPILPPSGPIVPPFGSAF